jgi:hypothetical protein
VDPSGKQTLKLNITASAASLEEDNMAMLVIKTNDPASQIVNVPVYMSKNGTPRVSALDSNIVIDEGTESTMTFTVIEPDNDDLTIALEDNGNVSRIAEITGGEATIAEDGKGATVANLQGTVTVKVVAAPVHGDEGNFNVTLSAHDLHYQTGSATTVYTVAHVNSAPEAVEYADILIDVNGVSHIVNFNDLFTDADGDDLVYTFTVSDGSVIEVYSSESSAMFVGLTPGETTVTVTATDPSGATAVNHITISVSEPSGVNDIVIAAEVNVWPNPVVETLNVSLGNTIVNATLSLTAMNGVTCYQATVDNSGDAHRIDMSAYPAGVYVLRVMADGAQAAYVIVKE